MVNFDNMNLYDVIELFVAFQILWCRALQEVWPKSLEKVNVIEPSQSMQRAGRSLIQGKMVVNFFKNDRLIIAFKSRIKHI